jgi:myosin-5
VQYVKVRNMVIRIQAMARMKIQRPKYLVALQEQKMQADMAYQLQKLKDRLREEQERNAQLQEERVSAPQQPGAAAAVSNVIMADAGGMIEKLQEENAKLRKKNDDLKQTLATVKLDNEKYKGDKEVSSAGYIVKVRQLEENVRERTSASRSSSWTTRSFRNRSRICP